MIIFEGPDGAGKTTLIQEVVKEFKLPVAPRVVSKDAEAMVDLKRWTEKNLAEGFQYTIFDRHRLFSEPIYGPILRDDAEPGFNDVEWLHQQFWQLYTSVKPVIVYCLPSLNRVQTNVRDDPDNTVVKRKIRSIHNLYLTKAATDIATYDRAVLYDYTKPHTKRRVFLAISEVLKGTAYDSHRRVSLGTDEF